MPSSDMALSPPNALLCASLPLPLLLVVLLLHLSKFHALTTNSFIYDNGFRPVNLTLTGESVITSSGALQLTNRRGLWSMGHAFYHDPLQFKDPSDASNTTASFSTQFIFAIVSGIETLRGSGFTFAVAPSMLPNTTGGDYVGLVRNSSNGNFSNHVFAVEFDTVLGTWSRDISDNHVGVDINGVISDTSQTAAYLTDDGENETIDLKSGKMIQAWVDYNANEKLLNLTLAPIPFASKPIRPLISYFVDLYPVLLDVMYVGFTSGTSNSASGHYILAWSFTINGKSQDLDLSNLPKISKKEVPIWKSASFLPYTTAFTALFFIMLVERYFL
ncbi:L-type lectin-domain containing receptor kinase IV.1-like [Nymphaea colorata]|nr:L-type lectin-domain containing receptor kinase IV.1-like [Nymphaea colorata]